MLLSVVLYGKNYRCLHSWKINKTTFSRFVKVCIILHQLHHYALICVDLSHNIEFCGYNETKCVKVQKVRMLLWVIMWKRHSLSLTGSLIVLGNVMIVTWLEQFDLCTCAQKSYHFNEMSGCFSSPVFMRVLSCHNYVWFWPLFLKMDVSEKVSEEFLSNDSASPVETVYPRTG